MTADVFRRQARRLPYNSKHISWLFSPSFFTPRQVESDGNLQSDLPL
jgi:hypothetical protein